MGTDSIFLSLIFLLAQGAPAFGDETRLPRKHGGIELGSTLAEFKKKKKKVQLHCFDGDETCVETVSRIRPSPYLIYTYQFGPIRKAYQIAGECSPVDAAGQNFSRERLFKEMAAYKTEAWGKPRTLDEESCRKTHPHARGTCLKWEDGRTEALLVQTRAKEKGSVAASGYTEEGVHLILTDPALARESAKRRARRGKRPKNVVELERVDPRDLP